MICSPGRTATNDGRAFLPAAASLPIYLKRGQIATARKVAALPGVRVHQDGGWRGEMTFVFPLGLFEQVAGIVKAKRLPGPRQLT